MANIKFNSKKPLKQISKNILFYTSGHKGRIVFNVCPCDYLILSLSVKCDVTIFTSYTISHRLTIIHMETAHFKVLQVGGYRFENLAKLSKRPEKYSDYFLALTSFMYPYRYRVFLFHSSPFGQWT